MEDSSDDEVPLMQRRAFRKALKLSQDEGERSSREESPIPAWISQHGTPSKAALTQKESSASSSGADDPVPAETQATKHRKGKSPKGKSSTKPKSSKPADPEVPHGGVDTATELTIVLPERVPKNRYNFELESADALAEDLAGDTGVIGRGIGEQDAAGEMVSFFDWNGKIFVASEVEAASTIMNVHIQAAEAKVEAIGSTYIRLQEVKGKEMEDARPKFIYDYSSGDDYASDGVTLKKARKKNADGKEDAVKKRAKKVLAGKAKPTKKATKKRPAAKKRAAKKK